MPSIEDEGLVVMIAHAEHEEVVGGGSGIELREYPQWIRFLCGLICIIAGTFCSMVFKWQNRVSVRVCEDCSMTLFDGALYQTQLMFFAESLAAFIYYVDRYFSRRANKASLFDFAMSADVYDQKPGPFWVWPLCGLLDFGATLMMMVALKVNHASTSQMLQNVAIIEILMLQPFVVKKAVRVHEVIGVVVITLALILTAIPAIQQPEEVDGETQSQSATVIACVLTIVGTTVQAFQYLMEEKCMRRGRSPPLRCVGWEGIGGIVWSMIAWPICQATHLEDINKGWWSALHSPKVSGISIAYLPIGLAYNVSGLATTLLGSGMLFSVCSAVRAPVVWVLCLLIKWEDYNHWSLASAIVFCIGFAFYINFLKKLPHGSSLDRCLSKPIHCCGCITDPSLDEPYDIPDQPSLPESTTGGGRAGEVDQNIL